MKRRPIPARNTRTTPIPNQSVSDAYARGLRVELDDAMGFAGIASLAWLDVAQAALTLSS